MEFEWHEYQLVHSGRQCLGVLAGIDGRHALGLGVQVLWRMCDKRSSMVRLRDRYALDRLLARSTNSVSIQVSIIYRMGIVALFECLRLERASYMTTIAGQMCIAHAR